MNPGTSLDTVREVATDLDLLLIMSVNPGFGGQAFIPEAVDKIRRARALLDAAGSTAALEVDGGIGRGTINACWRAGRTPSSRAAPCSARGSPPRKCAPEMLGASRFKRFSSLSVADVAEMVIPIW